MSNKETAKEIFESGIAKETGRDTIIVTMVQKGCSLNSAQNWYKEFADAAGLTVSRVGHKVEALEYIAKSKVDITELPSSGFGANPEEQAQIYQWIVANPNCEKSEFKDFMEIEMGRSPGSIDETWRGIKLARQLQGDGVKFAKTAKVAEAA